MWRAAFACVFSLPLVAVATAAEGLALRAVRASSYSQDGDHAPEHVGDDTTRRKESDNVPHTLEGVWEVMQADAREHAPTSRLLSKGAETQLTDSKEFLKFQLRADDKPHGTVHLCVGWCARSFELSPSPL